MPTAPNRATHDSRPLVLIADGGALADLNDRLAEEQSRREKLGSGDDAVPAPARRDFTKIPEAIVQAFATREGIQVECPIESRVLCAVGSEKAQNFLTRMGEVWTVKPFPLSLVKYERTADTNKDKHRFLIRFHAYMGYVLGLLAGTAERTAGNGSGLIVGVVTDDPHLLSCMTEAVSAGLSVRLIWWEALISDEVSYFAKRNGVTVLGLPIEDGADRPVRKRDSTLDQLLRSAGMPARGVQGRR